MLLVSTTRIIPGRAVPSFLSGRYPAVKVRKKLYVTEKDVAAMLHDATDIYKEDELAFKLRQMHLVNQSLRESGGSLVVPSAYAEGFVEKAPGKAAPEHK